MLFRLRVKASPNAPSPARSVVFLARPSWQAICEVVVLLHSHECPRGTETRGPCSAQHEAFDGTTCASWCASLLVACTHLS